MSVDSDQITLSKDQCISSIELSLMDTLAQQNLHALVADVTEIGLDALTDDDLVKSIPVFGTLIKLYNGYVAIRDRMFMKKVLVFQSRLADVEASKLDKFKEELAADKGSLQKAGLALILLLDRLDDIHKPVFIGRIYRAKIEGRIIMEEMHRYCFIVDRAYVGDLLSIRGRKMGEEIDGLLGHQLEGFGLVEETRLDKAVIGLQGGKINYVLNELGAHLSNILFENLNAV